MRIFTSAMAFPYNTMLTNHPGIPRFLSPVERHMNSTHDGLTVRWLPCCIHHPTYATPCHKFVLLTVCTDIYVPKWENLRVHVFLSKNIPEHRCLRRMSQTSGTNLIFCLGHKIGKNECLTLQQVYRSPLTVPAGYCQNAGRLVMQEVIIYSQFCQFWFYGRLQQRWFVSPLTFAHEHHSSDVHTCNIMGES